MPPQGLGEERPGHQRVVQCGGMELDEFQVGDGHARTKSHGHPVAGRLERVRRDGEHLAGAPGGHQHMVGGDRAHHAGSVDGRHAPAGSVDQEVDGEPAFQQDRRRGTYRSHQRPLDLDAGGGTTRMDHPRGGVPTLPGQGQGARLVPVEHRAQGDQLHDPLGPLVDQHPDRRLVTQPHAGRQRVGQVDVRRVRVAADHRRYAALRPPGGGLLQHPLGEHPDAQPVFGGAHGSRQPRNTAADHQQVQVRRVCRRAHGDTAAMLSISRARPNRQATNRRTSCPGPPRRVGVANVSGRTTAA